MVSADRDAYEVLHAAFDDDMNLDAVIEELFREKENLKLTDGSVAATDYSENMAYGIIGHFIRYWDNTKGYSTFLDIQDSNQPDLRHDKSEKLTDIPDTELPDYTKEQAIEDVYTSLQRLGLAVSEKPYAIYGISSDAMQKFYEENEDDDDLKMYLWDGVGDRRQDFIPG